MDDKRSSEETWSWVFGMCGFLGGEEGGVGCVVSSEEGLEFWWILKADFWSDVVWKGLACRGKLGNLLKYTQTDCRSFGGYGIC